MASIATCASGTAPPAIESIALSPVPVIEAGASLLRCQITIVPFRLRVRACALFWTSTLNSVALWINHRPPSRPASTHWCLETLGFLNGGWGVRIFGYDSAEAHAALSLSLILPCGTP
jgi:hypothetical protein